MTVTALECHGCKVEGRDGCVHECSPHPLDGRCYEWCDPCMDQLQAEAEMVRAEWLTEVGEGRDADVMAAGPVGDGVGSDAGD